MLLQYNNYSNYNNYNTIIIHVQTFIETCYLWNVGKF